MDPIFDYTMPFPPGQPTRTSKFNSDKPLQEGFIPTVAGKIYESLPDKRTMIDLIVVDNTDDGAPYVVELLKYFTDGSSIRIFKIRFDGGDKLFDDTGYTLEPGEYLSAETSGADVVEFKLFGELIQVITNT